MLPKLGKRRATDVSHADAAQLMTEKAATTAMANMIEIQRTRSSGLPQSLMFEVSSLSFRRRQRGHKGLLGMCGPNALWLSALPVLLLGCGGGLDVYPDVGDSVDLRPWFEDATESAGLERPRSRRKRPTLHSRDLGIRCRLL